MTAKKSPEHHLFSEISNAWLPPPDLTVSEWADEFRRIPPEASAEPGIWRTSRAEYQREVMNAVSDPLTERVVMMTAAQVGKSEILLNVLGYFIDQEPSPILLIQPTIEMGESFSKDRVAPMVRDTPCLREKIHDSKTRFSGNTIKEKKFPGGQITIAGANSPASLASRPIRVLLCDEVDRYPISAGTEGDPLSLAMKRTQNFWNRCIVWVSTPTLLGISRIEKAYNASSREEWCVPCPTCGEYQPYSWEQITFKDLPEPIMTCSKCGAKHNEVEWKAGQERGKWIAGNPDEHKSRGFHVNAFASAWVTWNIFAIVGRGREGMPSVSKPSRNNRRHVVLFTLGVTTIKGTLFSRLKVEKHGAGYCHFPLDAKHKHRGYDAVYFKGLLSERMVVKRVKGRDAITWEPRSAGIRNEPLDTRVYATGALELFNPNFEMHRRRRAKKTDTIPMPKLKPPVYEENREEKHEEKQPEKIPEEKKAVVKRSVSSRFIKRGLKL